MPKNALFKSVLFSSSVFTTIRGSIVLKLNLSFYYWHEVMGPMSFYSKGDFQVNEEDIFLLLSSVEPYTSSEESTISGPYFLDDQVIMVYNRSINYPEANDERLRMMGTDCWVLISCEVENELVLLSKIEIAKMVLDVEFGTIEEVSQLNAEMSELSSKAIVNIYH